MAVGRCGGFAWLRSRTVGLVAAAPSIGAPAAARAHAAERAFVLLLPTGYALLARGWDLLGLEHRHVTASFLGDYHAVMIIWSIQAGIIVLGHFLAVLVAHAIAVERFGPRRLAMASQLPLALLMIAYTTFGLWLLAAPTAG